MRLRSLILLLVLAPLLALTFPTKVSSSLYTPYLPTLRPQAPGLEVDSGQMPDPSVVWDPQARVYRMFTTQSLDGNVPESTSKSINGPWVHVSDALPDPPAWSTSPNHSLWAPEVADVNGVWTLWGSAEAPGSQNPMCLYRATAKTAAGPFTETGGPMCGPIATGGLIDPTMVHADGWWLIYKDNANAVGQEPFLWGQRLGHDGWPEGPIHTLLAADQPWETGLVEAPNMIQDPTTGHWWLVFSAGDFNPTGNQLPYLYHTYMTPCKSVVGPCSDSRIVPVVVPTAQGDEPGEQDAFTDRYGQVWIDYNPWGPFNTTYLRTVDMVGLYFTNGQPHVFTPKGN